jgi:hypothetical protein
MRLAAAIGTGQKGSQALICTLIFPLGTFPVPGVVALGSSVMTILILVIVASEIGQRNAAALTSASTETHASQTAGKYGRTGRCRLLARGRWSTTAMASRYPHAIAIQPLETTFDTTAKSSRRGCGADGVGLISWRWRRDLNPRRVAPHALSRRAL